MALAGVGKGKVQFDKRDDLKKRDSDRGTPSARQCTVKRASEACIKRFRPIYTYMGANHGLCKREEKPCCKGKQNLTQALASGFFQVRRGAFTTMPFLTEHWQ